MGFININVTKDKEHTGSVTVLVHRYVLALTISIATVQLKTYRFAEPPCNRPELRMCEGDVNLCCKDRVSVIRLRASSL
jgi:hypothetical protein